MDFVEPETFERPPGEVDRRRYADRIIRPVLALATLASILAPARSMVATGLGSAGVIFTGALAAIAVVVFGLSVAAAWDGHIPFLAWTVGLSPVFAFVWIALGLNLFGASAPAYPHLATALLPVGAILFLFIDRMPRGTGYSLVFGVACVMAWAAAGAVALLD